MQSPINWIAEHIPPGKEIFLAECQAYLMLACFFTLIAIGVGLDVIPALS